MHQKCKFSAFYSHFQVTFGQITSPPGHFRWHVTWHHFLSPDCPPPANYRSCTSWGSTATSRLLPVKWRHFRSLRIMLGHVTSFTVTWLPPSVSYSLVGAEAHPKREFSAFYSHFQVTFGQMTSLPVTSGHVRSRDVICCHLNATSCKLLLCSSWNLHKMQVFGLLEPLPGDFRSNDVTSRSLPVT